MALDPKQIKDLEDKLKAIERLSKKLGDSIDISAFKNLEKSADTINRLFQSMTDEFEELTGDIGYAVEGFKKVVGEITKTNQGVKDVTKGFSNLSSIAEKVQYYQKGISDLSVKEVEKLKEKTTQEKQRLANAASLLKSQVEQYQNQLKSNTLEESSRKKISEELAKSITALENTNGLIRNQDGLYNGLVATLDEVEESLKRQNKLLGLGGSIVDGLDKALEELGFTKLANTLGIEEASEKMHELAKEIEEAGGKLNFENKLKVLNAGVKSMGTNLIKNLKDPLAAVGFVVGSLIHAFKEIDLGAGKVAKNFGISFNEATHLKGEMNDIANFSGDINITTGKLTESFIELNNAFGTFADLSKESLVTFTKLTNQAGISKEAAIELTRASILNNKTVEETTTEYLGQIEAFKAQTGSAVNTKLVLEDIAKISAATALTLGNTPEALAEAAVTARALGMNIEQVNSAASQLLNFESSIESELEAELLIGRDLNLEEARRAALNGDIASLAKEISKQIGTAADFSKMNVIQQEALAKSVGMTREDLAKTLRDQEVLTKLKAKEGESAQEAFNRRVKEVGLEKAKKELGDESLANMYAGQNVQERFAAIMEKIQEVFVSLAEPLMPVISALTDIFKIVGPIAGVLGTIVKYTVMFGKYLLIPLGIIKAFQFTLLGITSLQKLFVGLKTQEIGLDKIGLGFKKAFHLLTAGIFTTEGRILFAKRAGLITDTQATAVSKANLALQNQNIVGSRAINFYKNKTLAAAIRENIVENSILGTLGRKVVAGLAYLGNKLKGFALTVREFALDKLSLATEFAKNTAKTIGNSLSLVGIGLAIRQNAATLVGLLAQAGRFILSMFTAGAQAPFPANIVLPFVLGAVAGGIAGTIIGKYSKKGDDVVSPGYGKRTLMAPEGAIALNDKDTVIAGTDLGGKNKNKTEIGAPAPSAPSIDYTALASAIVSALSASPMNVNVEGKINDKVLLQFVQENATKFNQSSNVGSSTTQ